MSLRSKLIRLIHMDGPMTVAQYMHHCLHDPDHGYYASNPGIGRDFITAPEISQVFGELIGLWAANEAVQINTNCQWTLTEFGPGRATLMADALRALRRVGRRSTFAKIALVEASPELAAYQAERLSNEAPQHVSSVAALHDTPSIIVANEFLDCLPARQFIPDGGRVHEVLVGLDENDRFVFGRSGPLQSSPENSGIELQLGLEALVETLALRTQPFRALFIDYGHSDGTSSDTLRAYRNGKQIHPLVAPGESDLTVDVDFRVLTNAATKAGLTVYGPVDQSTFLLSLGLEERTQQMIAQNPVTADDIYARIRRLVDPAEMGTRFKVVCVTNFRDTAPSGFEMQADD